MAPPPACPTRRCRCRPGPGLGQVEQRSSDFDLQRQLRCPRRRRRIRGRPPGNYLSPFSFSISRDSLEVHFTSLSSPSVRPPFRCRCTKGRAALAVTVRGYFSLSTSSRARWAGLRVKPCPTSLDGSWNKSIFLSN